MDMEEFFAFADKFRLDISGAPSIK